MLRLLRTVFEAPLNLWRALVADVKRGVTPDGRCASCRRPVGEGVIECEDCALSRW